MTAARRRARLVVMIRVRHTALPLLTLVLALAGCRTSAPHGLESAAINTALAGVVAGVSVSQGGCVAICTQGWVCNPRTGLCEAPPEFKCVGGDLKSGLCSNRPDDLSTGQGGAPGTSSLPANLGISPATGSTPPPPAEASPRPP
jgi:hypothetical protein